MTALGSAVPFGLVLAMLGLLAWRTRSALGRARSAEDEMRRSEEQYRLLFHQNPNPMWVYDLETLRFLAVNDSAISHYGYSRDAFLAMTLLDIRPREDASRLLAGLRDGPSRGIWRHRKRDGTLIDVDISARDVRFQGRSARLVLAMDVTEQRRALVALEESERRYRDLFENASSPIATVDLDERITEVNDAFASLLGWSPEEMVGTRIDAYMAAHELGSAERQLRRKLRGETRLTTFEQEYVARDGRSVVLEVTTRLIERDGKPIGTQGVCRDVTREKQAQRERDQLEQLNRHQALHDPVTGLPNRANFRSTIENALSARDDRGGRQLAVLVMDIDRFKQVNETLGHNHGDLLLHELGHTLGAALPTVGQLARLGGDEFGILLDDPGDLAVDGALVAERIKQLLQEPVTVDGLPLKIDVSIGIACFPRDADTADLLLQRAEVAMYHAKGNGQSHTLYQSGHDRSDKGRLQLLGELRRALDDHELVLHYQPKLDLATERVDRLEALLRWQHPSRGLLLPAEFLPLAEQTSLIRPITFYVVEAALQQLDCWRGQSGLGRVAVNLSARNLGDPELCDRVSELLRRYEVDPERLLFEVTETAIIADPHRAEQTLTALRRLGVKLAVDDFGRGYSSLAFIGTLPLDHLKIDRLFVTSLDRNGHYAAITRALVTLAHNLDLVVVGEGVETAETADHLRELGCDLAQGYFYTPPLPPPEVAAWVRRRRAASIVAVA